MAALLATLGYMQQGTNEVVPIAHMSNHNRAMAQIDW